MNIQLKKPYKIAPLTRERYGAHYQIIASQAIVFPTRLLGNEVMGDIHWKTSDGSIEVKTGAMFSAENLLPLSDKEESDTLYEIWMNSFGSTPAVTPIDKE